MHNSTEFGLTSKTIHSEEEQNKSFLRVTVSLTDTEVFNSLKDLCVDILGDERIEESIREEYYSRLANIMREIKKSE